MAIGSDNSDFLLTSNSLEAAREFRDRFMGALIGLAIGDAVAAATQYRRPGSFTPVGDMIGGGPFDLPRGGWSDDTAMALCLADSLLACEGFDASDQLERYQRWQLHGYLSATGHCVGITAGTTKAIAQWSRELRPGSGDLTAAKLGGSEPHSSEAPYQLDPDPLSRVGPAVLFSFALGLEAVERAASEASWTTCQAPKVLEACRALARALFSALSGQSKAEVVAVAWHVPSSRTPSSARGPSPASEVLNAALEAFATTDNFRDAVLHAANLGGNSDVIAAVCGQLAGAFYTVNAIPALWRDSVLEKRLLEGYADRLLAHALVGLMS